MSDDADDSAMGRPKRHWLGRLTAASTLLLASTALIASGSTVAAATQPPAKPKVTATATRSVRTTHPFTAMHASPSGAGYTLVASDGGVFNFGNSHFEGSGAAVTGAAPVTGMAQTPDGNGYWLVTAKGQVEAFGDAPTLGSLTAKTVHTRIVGIAATKDGNGYWLAGANGSVHSFGAALNHGSLTGVKRGTTVVSIAADPAGGGYWLETNKGTVHAYGNARSHGSLPAADVSKGAAGIVPTTDGKGYWLPTAQGGVINRGDARLEGSAVHRTLKTPVVAMAPSHDDRGYWLLERDGTVLSFGDARNHGSAVTVPVPAPKPAPASGTVGVYGFFPTESMAATELREGWPIIGDAGGLGTPQSPYVAEVTSHPDLNVIQAIAATHAHVNWLSFWTVSWPAKGDSYYHAGYAGGHQAAATLASYSARISPDMVVLDPEGYNENHAATTQAEWRQFIQGWAAGLHSVDKKLTAGYYANQSQVASYGLSKLPWPLLVAISPIDGNHPSVRGGNIIGYAGYLGGCPAKSYVSTMRGWGGKVNTLQFNDNGVDCAP